MDHRQGRSCIFARRRTGADEYILYVIQLERQTGEWLLGGGYAGEAVTHARRQLTFAPGPRHRTIMSSAGRRIDRPEPQRGSRGRDPAGRSLAYMSRASLEGDRPTPAHDAFRRRSLAESPMIFSASIGAILTVALSAPL